MKSHKMPCTTNIASMPSESDPPLLKRSVEFPLVSIYVSVRSLRVCSYVLIIS